MQQIIRNTILARFTVIFQQFKDMIDPQGNCALFFFILVIGWTDLTDNYLQNWDKDINYILYLLWYWLYLMFTRSRWHARDMWEILDSLMPARGWWTCSKHWALVRTAWKWSVTIPRYVTRLTESTPLCLISRSLFRVVPTECQASTQRWLKWCAWVSFTHPLLQWYDSFTE